MNSEFWSKPREVSNRRPRSTDDYLSPGRDRRQGSGLDIFLSGARCNGFGISARGTGNNCLRGFCRDGLGHGAAVCGRDATTVDRGIFKGRETSTRRPSIEAGAHRVLHNDAAASVVSATYRSIYQNLSYTYDGEIDVAGVQVEPTPIGEV